MADRWLRILVAMSALSLVSLAVLWVLPNALGCDPYSRCEGRVFSGVVVVWGLIPVLVAAAARDMQVGWTRAFQASLATWGLLAAVLTVGALLTGRAGHREAESLTTVVLGVIAVPIGAAVVVLVRAAIRRLRYRTSQHQGRPPGPGEPGVQ